VQRPVSLFSSTTLLAVDCTRVQHHLAVQRAGSHKETQCDNAASNGCAPPNCCYSCPPHYYYLPQRSFTVHGRNADLATVRKPPPQKAWTQGTNPITQRPSNPPAANGAVNTPKPAQNSATASGETATPMRHLSDRMMYLLANLTVSSDMSFLHAQG
jgi:hypothetical protein